MKYEVTSLNTKKTLAASLKKLMEQEPFSKITISQIVADCGVNRKTFYYHFNDIYDLLKWMLDQEAVEIVKQFDLLLDFEDTVNFVMDYVEQNKHILNCAFDSIGQEGLKRFLHADFNETVSTMINHSAKTAKITLPEDFRDFLAKLYTEAVVGILVDWITDKDRLNREKTLTYLSLIFNSAFPSVLKNADDYFKS